MNKFYFFFACCRNLTNVPWVRRPWSIINDQPSNGVHFSFVEITRCVRLGRNKILFYRFSQTSKHKLHAPTSSKLSNGLCVPSIHGMCVYSTISSRPGLRVRIAQRSSSKDLLRRKTVNEHFGVRSLHCTLFTATEYRKPGIVFVSLPYTRYFPSSKTYRCKQRKKNNNYFVNTAVVYYLRFVISIFKDSFSSFLPNLNTLRGSLQINK